jgi:hypothetical protein
MFRQQQRKRPQHPHWSACRDGDCPRTPCIAFKVGYDYGKREGREEAEEAAK